MTIDDTTMKATNTPTFSTAYSGRAGFYLILLYFDQILDKPAPTLIFIGAPRSILWFWGLTVFDRMDNDNAVQLQNFRKN
jgi:hypothetical protein